MTVSDPAKPALRSFAGELLYAVRYYLGNRIGLVAMAALALGLGTYYTWGWLVAAGFAPIILSALPCVAMCALGLCMSGRSKSPTGTPDESGGEQTLGLTASPGENQDASDASDQPTPATSRNRKGCC